VVARRFRFQLEALLRVREVREREAKRKVGAKRAEIARIDDLNRQCAEEISRHQDRLRQGQLGTLDTAELARQRAWIAYLRGTVVERQALRAAMIKELERLREELREARKQKRIIEKLRQRRWDEYIRNRKRSEQAEADELAQQLHRCEGRLTAVPSGRT
jgi:flagellar FliJ protein